MAAGDRCSGRAERGRAAATFGIAPLGSPKTRATGQVIEPLKMSPEKGQRGGGEAGGARWAAKKVHKPAIQFRPAQIGGRRWPAKVPPSIGRPAGETVAAGCWRRLSCGPNCGLRRPALLGAVGVRFAMAGGAADSQGPIQVRPLPLGHHPQVVRAPPAARSRQRWPAPPRPSNRRGSPRVPRAPISRPDIAGEPADLLARPSGAWRPAHRWTRLGQTRNKANKGRAERERASF
jgi:hypothetical protein